jgi:APA family basic amino acid/polyamine antiporter
LFYVNYAYQGWNAATYIAGEIRRPSTGVPKALIVGTLLVTGLYLLVNAGFLLSTPAEKMAGQPEVGLIVAKNIFGDKGGAVIGMFIAFGLISAISAMTWAGPRVGQSMGQDYAALGFLARTNRHGVPVAAVVIQSLLALLMLFTASFKTIMLYLEFILNLSLAATVAGVFWLRWRRPDLTRPYRCLGYPVTPALFLALAAYLEWRLLTERTIIALAGLGTVVLGLFVYALVWAKRKP